VALIYKKNTIEIRESEAKIKGLFALFYFLKMRN